MRISHTWLKEIVDIKLSEEKLASELTRIGFPVEGVEATGGDLTGFVVGRVIEAGKHPNADKLTLCRVDVGEDEPLQIICGAPNAKVGLNAAVATVGAVLPDGMKIKKAKLRGVESRGMMCSERELGLSQAHDGIIDLGPTAPAPGTPLANAMSVGDTLFDIDIPSNRGDCFSHIGIARELSALTGAPVRMPESEVTEAIDAAKDLATVETDDLEGCPRYLARIIRNVKVGPSPDWLVQKLHLIGQRSINNVVDVTNLVLWEAGQPLHAFDYDRIAGKKIIVRRARDGESLTTLDGQERKLTPEVLVIADAEKPVALGGIMGGANSEVTEVTKTVLLEGAFFDSFRVLRGAHVVRLTTDASLRFIRGVDPIGVARNIDRAARLLAEVSGGEVLAGRIEVADDERLKPRRVGYRPGAAERLLGEPIPADESKRILESLGFAADKGSFVVPPHRADVTQECDLVEEIARLYGYDRLGESHSNASGLVASHSRYDRDVLRIRNAWLALGFSEMVSRAFADPGDMIRSGLDRDDVEKNAVMIPNPQSSEESALRMSLLPESLRIIAHNLHHGWNDLRLFEVGSVFRRDPSSELALEPAEVIAVATGGDFGPDLTRRDPAMDYFRFKGAVEAFLEVLRVDTPVVRCYDETGFETRTSAIIEAGGKRIGAMGQVASDICEAWDIDRPVFAARFQLSELLGSIQEITTYEESSKYPASRRDLAFLVDADVPEDRVSNMIRELGGSLLRGMVLFDRFSGKPLPEGQVSLGYALTWQADKRTLSDEEVRRAESRVVDGLTRNLGARLRDK